MEFHTLLITSVIEGRMTIQNFGRNITLCPPVFRVPQSEQELLEVMDGYRGHRMRAVGRLHSWSQILEADDVVLDLRDLNHVDAVQEGDHATVRVGAGCQIKRLLRELHRQGNWTLPSLGFVTEQTVAGAVSTGTHGTGKHSLSQYVRRVRVAHYQGRDGTAVISEIESGDELAAARCSLGAMGIIVSVDIDVRPKYVVEEHFQELFELEDVLRAERDFPLQQFYLVPWRWSFFVQHRREVDGRRSGLAGLYRAYRFLVIDVIMHWAIFGSMWRLAPRGSPQYLFRKILPHCVIKGWRVTEASAKQLVMEHELFRHVEIELFVKRSDLAASLHMVRDLVEFAGGDDASLEDIKDRWNLSQECVDELQDVRHTYVHHFPICVRRILPDDTLISMTSRIEVSSPEEDWYSVSVCCYDRRACIDAFPSFAKVLARGMKERFNARLHWGKLYPLEPHEIRGLYPKLPLFREIVHRVDPSGRFRNGWVASILDEDE